MTNKICGIHGVCLTCSILVKMSWQVRGHFCKTMRHQDSFEKYYNDKTKRCGIGRLHDNFKVNGRIL